MATLDLSQFKPIPGFDCVEWKRERQTKIFEETKHLTLEERRERSRRASERFWADIERRRAELAAEAESDGN